MAKEVLKLGSIVCTIEADKSYRASKNEDEDFTLAGEKPNLRKDVLISPLQNDWKSFQISDGNVIIKCNAVGSEIIALCNGKRTIESIADEIAEKFDVEENDDEFLEQVKTFLNIFKTFKLI